MKVKSFILSNGVKIPQVGYGTWQITDEKECVDGVLWALEAGYYHIDTAAVYKNEQFIAKALEKTKIPRQDIFITSKLNASKKGYDVTLEEFNETLKRLNTDYLDLYLIHAPRPWGDTSEVNYDQGNIESWKAMIDLYKQGKIKAIGVSNFDERDIENLIKATGFVPHVNQIKIHIGYPNKKIKEYCEANNILVEAYCPLANGKIFKEQELVEFSKKYHVSLAQLAIRWCLDYNTLPLPKSVKEARIIENFKLDFKITQSDFDYLLNWQNK